jgi:hypothetical protein
MAVMAVVIKMIAHFKEEEKKKSKSRNLVGG